MSSEISSELANSQIKTKLSTEDIVDPWKVVSKSATGVDYEKLIGKNIQSNVYNIFLKLAYR